VGATKGGLVIAHPGGAGLEEARRGELLDGDEVLERLASELTSPQPRSKRKKRG
jgi:hypothetical protein